MSVCGGAVAAAGGAGLQRQLHGPALLPSRQCGHAPLGNERFAVPFKLLQRIFVVCLCIEFIARVIGIALARAWGGKWEALLEWQMIELCNEQVFLAHGLRGSCVACILKSEFLFFFFSGKAFWCV